MYDLKEQQPTYQKIIDCTVASEITAEAFKESLSSFARRYLHWRFLLRVILKR